MAPKVVVGRKIDVLDHGFVRLVDSMGSDLSIARNARVSYDAAWRAGDDSGSDARLINYLYKNGHNTPFEAVVFTFDVKAPIFIFRQWHRHRTQCLSGDTRLRFSRPSNGTPYWKTIKELHDQWNIEVKPVKRPDKQVRNLREFKRDMIRSMELYCIENESEITTTKVCDIWQSGEKEVFLMKTSTGDEIKASKDHRFLTDRGWLTLKNISIGMNILSIGKIAPKNIIKDSPPFTLDELDVEYWKETKYTNVFVSNLGRVMRNSKIIQPTLNNANRLVIGVKGDGWQAIQVSRLVMDTFCEIQNKLHVLHKDDCVLNNRLENLRYGSDKDNHQDALENGRRAFKGITKIEVISIESVGMEMTYDLEVDHPDHNFIAENFCTHNSYNELSARYKELPEEFYVPAPEQITEQSTDNKQMRTDEIHPLAYPIAASIRKQNSEAFRIYKALLETGCPRELARSVLPVGTYSHMFATMNLHNLFRFLGERLHPHAQFEIRVFAEALLELIEPIVPVAVRSFKLHTLNMEEDDV